MYRSIVSAVVGAVAIFVLVAPVFVQASTWTIDTAHTNAQFAVSHMLVSTVRGYFSEVSGVMKLDESDPTQSSVEVSIDVGALYTGNQKRDGHWLLRPGMGASMTIDLSFRERASRLDDEVTAPSEKVEFMPVRLLPGRCQSPARLFRADALAPAAWSTESERKPGATNAKEEIH